MGPSLVAQMVKNLPAMWETRVPSLVRKIPEEENGYPLQYSRLENCMARGAWRATVHGVSESDMTEKQFYIICIIHIWFHIICNTYKYIIYIECMDFTSIVIK